MKLQTIFAASLLWVAALDLASADVNVSSEQVVPLTGSNDIKVKAGYHWSHTFSINTAATVVANVQVHNRVYSDVNAWICSEDGYQDFAEGRRNDCRGRERGKGAFELQQELSPGRYRLVIDNSISAFLTKRVTTQLTAFVTLPSHVRREFESGLKSALHEVQGRFQVGEFDLNIAPCGFKNAYSERADGDITFCSELFFDLIRKGQKGALGAVLSHELAHTLMNRLGLPNYDNEEAADELALVMLLWDGRQEYALDWIEYYEERNSQREAWVMLEQGSRHPLSVQRIRNIERILDRPEQVVSRWNNLLYPHFTDSGLRAVIDNPGRFHDRALARNELKSR